MNIKYEVRTDKSFEKAVDDLKKNLGANQFGVLWELNFKDKLREKGIEFDTNFKIFEVCNPVQAKEVLSRHIDVGYFLPCKLVVYEKNNSTFVGMMKPMELIQMLGYDDLTGVAGDVEKILEGVIENTK